MALRSPAAAVKPSFWNKWPWRPGVGGMRQHVWRGGSTSTRAHHMHAQASTHARTHARTSSGADVGLADGDSVSDDFVKAWDAAAFVRPPPLRASLTAIEGDRRQEASGLGTASAPYSSERFGFRLSESLPQPEAGGAYAGWICEHILALVRGDG